MSVASYLADKYKSESSDAGELARALIAVQEQLSDAEASLEELEEWQSHQRFRQRELRTIYRPAPPHLAALPSPRLQFRWGYNEWSEGYEYACRYELVLPIREHDCRGEMGKPFEACITLSITTVGGTGEPWKERAGGSLAPFRDGVHAKWDSELLGNLPVWVIGPDGMKADISESAS